MEPYDDGDDDGDFDCEEDDDDDDDCEWRLWKRKCTKTGSYYFFATIILKFKS